MHRLSVNKRQNKLMSEDVVSCLSSASTSFDELERRLEIQSENHNVKIASPFEDLLKSPEKVKPGYTDINKMNLNLRAEEFYPSQENILEKNLDTENREISKDSFDGNIIHKDMSKLNIVSSGNKDLMKKSAKWNHLISPLSPENIDVANLPSIDIAEQNLKIGIKDKEEKVYESFHQHSKQKLIHLNEEIEPNIKDIGNVLDKKLSCHDDENLIYSKQTVNLTRPITTTTEEETFLNKNNPLSHGDDDDDDSVITEYSDNTPVRDIGIKSTVKAQRKSPIHGKEIQGVRKALEFESNGNISSIPSTSFSRLSQNIRRSSLHRTPKAAAYLAKYNMLEGIENKENESRVKIEFNNSTKSNFALPLSREVQENVQKDYPKTNDRICPEYALIQEVTQEEYDAAPRIVKMQVSLDDVNSVVNYINDWWIAKCSPKHDGSVDCKEVSITEIESIDLLNKAGFLPRKCKSILCALCHWKKMTIKMEGSNSGSSRSFVCVQQ